MSISELRRAPPHQPFAPDAPPLPAPPHPPVPPVLPVPPTPLVPPLLAVGIGSTTVSPLARPDTTWVVPPALSPTVIGCRDFTPFFSNVTYAFPLERVTASVGTTSTLLSCR